jgi:hypothetical protein
VKSNKRARRVKVSADGQGVVSHAGVGLLREMAEETWLFDEVTAALIDTYKSVPVYAPGPDRPEVAFGRRWPGCCAARTRGRTPTRTTSQC